MATAIAEVMPHIGEGAVKRKNLAGRVLTANSFLPYLPFTGYIIDPEYRNTNYDPEWKKRADIATPPKIIESIYKNLYERGFVPSYDIAKNFTMVSYGSNIPTIERLIFDLDRQHRGVGTNVTAVDLQSLPQVFISILTFEGENKCSFRFVNNQEEDHYPTEPIDMILNYRASLYYYIHGGYAYNASLFGNARYVLLKYYNELSDTGCVVVDFPQEDYLGRNADTQMSTATGQLILDFGEEIGIDELFDIEIVGEGKARVMVLKKKPRKPLQLE